MYKVPFYKPTYFKNLDNISGVNHSDISSAPLNLEEKFKVITDREFALSVNNPSSAIHLALCALDLKRGDKIICPVNSYVDIPEAIRHFDSEPIFTDIEPKSYHMSIDSLKDVITKNRSKKLKAIIISHFSGFRENLVDIVKIAKENNLVIIEDYTSASVSERRVEVQGDIAIFSLNYKLDNTLKGAIITFNKEDIYSRAKLVREHGLIDTNKDVSYIYDIVDIGCDYRLDDLSAYLLSWLLERREELVAKRISVAQEYFIKLKNIDHISLPIESKEHQYSYFIVEVSKNRDAFARELKERGVEVGLHYIPLNFTTYYKEKYGLKIFSFPNALKAYQKVMSIPCNSKMTKEDIKYVTNAIKEVASKHI